MPRGPRTVEASRSAAASRGSSARKASPASARLGRRMVNTTRQRAASGRSGGREPSVRGPIARTRQQLYQEAKARNIKGRSSMTKAELERALTS